MIKKNDSNESSLVIGGVVSFKDKLGRSCCVTLAP